MGLIARKLFKINGMLNGSEEGGWEDQHGRHEVDSLQEADAIASEASDGLHYPVLDIDFRAKLLRSETPNHFHLYLDKGMPWEDMEKLLRVLAEVGIVEQGYADASIQRRNAFVAVRPWKEGKDVGR